MVYCISHFSNRCTNSIYGETCKYNLKKADLGYMENPSYCVYMIKQAGSFTEIPLLKG